MLQPTSKIVVSKIPALVYFNHWFNSCILRDQENTVRGIRKLHVSCRQQLHFFLRVALLLEGDSGLARFFQ